MLVFFVALSQNVTIAGDRNMLTERFTSSTCPPCATYNPTLETFLNSSDPDRVTNISYHMSGPAPGNDPMYWINPTDNDARRVNYGVNSIPDWFFDGILNVAPNGGQAPLQAAFNQRTNILSPISIVVLETKNGTNVNVKVDIYCEGLISNPNVVVQMSAIEKIVYYNGTNGESNFTYVMRKMYPTAAGTTVTLLPGNKVSLEYNYVMDPTWNPALMENLVFVQASSKEILNSAIATRNFNLVSSPATKVVNLGQNGNGTFKAIIPAIANGFNSPVSFTYEVEPANAGITATFPNGSTISNFPDSLTVDVTSTASVPAGEYKIIFTGTSASGATHKTFVNYLVGKAYIGVGNNRSALTYKVDNLTYNSARAFTWDLNSTHTLEAVSPQTIGNSRYIFENWSNGGTQVQTITTGTAIGSYTANFSTHYRLLGFTSPSGLPVTISNSGSYLDSGSVNDITLSSYQVQHNGKTYYFSSWEGTGTGSYTGSNQTANITMNSFISQKAIFDTIDVGISNYNSLVPEKFALYQNYPNPFNPTTNIKFDISKSSITSLVVYDMLGKEVSTLVNEVLAPGSYQYTFNAVNFPSGIFYYKITTEGYSEIRKMILIK